MALDELYDSTLLLTHHMHEGSHCRMSCLPVLWLYAFTFIYLADGVYPK